MNHAKFTDEIDLAEQAENLGRMALMMGLVPSFVVRHFPIAGSFIFLMKLPIDSRPKKHIYTSSN